MNQTYGQLVDELTYRSYAHNRSISPDVAPERWKLCYGEQVDVMEARLQLELACERRES